MGTLTVFWYVIVGGIALAMGILWFILEKKIKEEEVDNRVEPDIHDLFDDYVEENESLTPTPSPKNPLYTEFKDDEALVSLKEEEDFESLQSASSHESPAEPTFADFSADLSFDQKSRGVMDEETPPSFSMDPSIGSKESTYQPQESTVDSPSFQPEIREYHGEYAPQMAEAESDRSPNEESMMESDPNIAPQKPIFERNRPTFMERVKGLFGKKERMEREREDGSLILDPETGETIIRRPAPVKTVALILQAPADQPYHFDEVLEIAEQQQLMIGKDGFLMHLTTTHYGDEPTYSIAHLLHPGSFRAEGIEEMDLPGLLFFANIPGPDPEIDTIEYLVNIAATFGSALGGTLFDDQGEAVTEKSLKKLYEEINALDKAEWDRAISEHY